MTALPVLAVTGSTGEVGGRVAARLAALGVAQRLVVRDPSRAPALAGAQVVAAAGGYADGDGMRRALSGVHTVFLVSAQETPGRVEQHLTAVRAAVDAGVTRIVYTSYLAAAPDATFTFARDHFHTEEAIRAAGVRHTFLRNSMYLDFLPVMVGADDVIRGPAGDGRIAMVARDDVADVAAAVLTGEGHDGRTYDVTGAEALTMTELAAALARATGRPVTFHDETIEQAWASRAHHGAPDFAVEGWVTSYAAIATGEMDVVSDTVRQVAGHPRSGWPRAWPPSVDGQPAAGALCGASCAGGVG
ncbi:MAG TPA: NmrA family NAD(P)-binding protein [Actinomycetes bacterium]